MTVAERVRVTVDLEADCVDAGCAALAQRLQSQLATGRYAWPCSLMRLPGAITDWQAEHRTARRRAGACVRDGYRFAEIDRALFEDDIFAINTSAEERQGRPMAAAYLERQPFGALGEQPCARHRLHTYGVVDHGGRLRAYTWVYRVGELVMFSSILGHAAHLGRHVMYLLVQGVLADQIQAGPGFAFYNMHDSGTDGLRFFKERCGFAPARVGWSLT